MPPVCQDANIRKTRRRKTRNKTFATTTKMSPASATAKSTNMNSVKTFSTRSTIKTISKKKIFYKRQGRWKITPTNNSDPDFGTNIAKTLATSQAKKTSAKYSSKRHAKILWRAFNSPSMTPVNFPAKPSFKIPEMKNPQVGRKSATKITRSGNVEAIQKVQCVDTATVSVMGLLIEGLGMLKRKRQNTRYLSRQKDLLQSTTSGEKDQEEVVPVKKQQMCMEDKARSAGTIHTNDDVKEVEKEAMNGKEVGENKSKSVTANQEDMRRKKKEKGKKKKKMQQNLSRISAFEYYNVANTQEKFVPNKRQKTSRQAKDRTDPTITTINDTNEEMTEVNKVANCFKKDGEQKSYVLKNVRKEIKQKKKEKNKLKKKQLANHSSTAIKLPAKDRPLIATSNSIGEVQKETKKAKDTFEKKNDSVKFNQEVKLNKKEKKKAKRKKQQQKAAKRELGKEMKKGRLEKDSSVNFFNPDGSKSQISVDDIKKSKKRQMG